MKKICTNCHYQGKSTVRGSFLISLILLCCGIIPGIIYEIWRGNGGKNSCPKCGKNDMIPLDTPLGQKLANDIAEVTPSKK